MILVGGKIKATVEKESPSLITHQPTAAEPYVELEDNTDASYQWYIVEEDITEITNENASAVSYDWGESSYDKETGWTGVPYWEDSYGQEFFTVALEAGETVVVEITGDFSDGVGLFDYNTDMGDWVAVEDGVTSYELTVASKGNYTFYTDVNSGVVTVKAYKVVVDYTEIEGETAAELQNPVVGDKYLCEMTYGDGKKEKTADFEYVYAIAHQPTVAEPYVELNDNTDASYQWYTVEGDGVEITDKNASGDWQSLGAPFNNSVYEDGKWIADNFNGMQYYFMVDLEAGDTINFEFASEVEAIIFGIDGDFDGQFEVGDTKYSITVEESGTYWLITLPVDYVRAYTGSSTYTAIDGETAAELENPGFGTRYACEVTFADGTKEMSDIFEYTYAITHQPTVEEPYVELNDNTDASYQWYTVEEGIIEITNENASTVSYDWGESSYDKETGWTGVLYAEDSYEQDFFTVALEAGETVTIEVTGDFADGVGLYDYDTEEDIWVDYIEGVTSYNLTTESEGNYTFYTYVNSGVVTVKAYKVGVVYTAIDGETAAAFIPTALGKYTCEATFADGTKEMSDSFEVTHICDFSGEWKADSEKHWKECSCGDIAEEGKHSWIHGDCTECGYACEHSFTNYTETKAPTCTEAGREESPCDYCDAMDYNTIPEINHKDTLVQVDAQAKTCTEIGWDTYEYCTACDYSTYVEIPASHEIKTVGKKDATCTEAGHEAYEYCTECDYTTYKEIPSNGHTPLEAVKENEVAPECGVAGSYDLIVYCDVCGEELDRDTVAVDALTHTDADGDYLCDHGCGHALEKPVDPTPGGSGEPDTPDVPDTPDEPTDGECDHICHDAPWFIRIFWEIVNLFYRIFGINQVCSCGAAHY